MSAGGLTHRYFGVDGALFLGPLPPGAVHAHHAVQGSVALQGRLRVSIAGRAPDRAAAVLIAPDVPHAVSASGLVAHFYALPESRAGSRLVAAFAGREAIELDGGRLGPVRRALREAPSDERLFPACLDLLMQVALCRAPPEPRRNPRPAKALASLRSRSASPSLAALAREVGLSPDRLRHLIREQAGIPLRRYRRWVRLLGAIEALREGQSVTEAAHAAGFADAAHLSRVFREAFTFPPSLFRRNSRFVQASGGRRA